MIYYLVIFNFLFAQTEIQNIMKRGVEFHEKGEYNKAIEMYREAIKIEPENDIAYYELAMTYFQIEDYEKAFDYGNKAIDLEGESQLKAYNLCGSALNMMGNERKAKYYFKKGIKKFDENYELCYNLALVYFKQNDFQEAKKILQKGLNDNPKHSSSHLLLGECCFVLKEYEDAMFSFYYFLLLEFDTPRSRYALENMRYLFVKKFSDLNNKGGRIKYVIEGIDELNYSTIFFALLNEASKNKENDSSIQLFNLSDENLYSDFTKKFFNPDILRISNRRKDIWNKLYKPFFNDLVNSPHLETYCFYICQSTSETARTWLDENPDKVQDYLIWLRN